MPNWKKSKKGKKGGNIPPASHPKLPELVYEDLSSDEAEKGEPLESSVEVPQAEELLEALLERSPETKAPEAVFSPETVDRMISAEADQMADEPEEAFGQKVMEEGVQREKEGEEEKEEENYEEKSARESEKSGEDELMEEEEKNEEAEEKDNEAEGGKNEDENGNEDGAAEEIDDAIGSVAEAGRRGISSEELMRSKLSKGGEGKKGGVKRASLLAFGPSVMIEGRAEESDEGEATEEERDESSESEFENGGFEERVESKPTNPSRRMKERERMEVKGRERSVKAMMCQVEENGAVAVRIGKPSADPDFLFVPNKVVSELSVKVSVCNWEGERKVIEKAMIGDIIEVGEWKGRPKPANWISPALKINSAAEVTSISKIKCAERQLTIGMVAAVVRNIRESNKFRFLDLAVPGLTVMQRLYRHQLTTDPPKEGSLVEVCVVQIDHPPNVAIGPSGLYILPADSDKVSGVEQLEHKPILGARVGEEVEGYQFPFSPGCNLTVCEKGVAAGLAACLLKTKAELSKVTIQTTIHVLQMFGKMMVATFEKFIEGKRKFVDLVESWEEDSSIEATVVDKRKPCASGRILETNKYRQGGIFVFQAKILLSRQLARRYDTESDWDAMGEGAEIKLVPVESFRAMEARMALFDASAFSQMALRPDGTGRIWQSLLSLAETKLPSASLEEPLISAHPSLQRLEGPQRKSAVLMMDDEPRVVAQQAPPGSGKTFTLASIVAALLTKPDVKILCLAPLNVAVVKICEELIDALTVEGSNEVPLALFSGSSKVKYREQLDRISGSLLESAVTGETFWEQLEKRDPMEVKKYRMEVKKYREQVRKRPRIAKEGKIAEMFLSVESRRIICCTLGFAEQIGTMLADRNAVAVDEAGQAPFSQLCATLSSLASIKKVLLTGDRYQLAVNLQSVPESIRTGFGFDTVLINADGSVGVDKTTLEINYRSHSQIVQCVEYSAYSPHGEVLKPGPGVFRMLTQFAKMPVEDSPIVLINQLSEMEAEETSFSASNAGQTRTVIQLLTSWNSFPGSVRIISLYAGQAKQIGREILAHGLPERFVSSTADSVQGHESDLAIVVTTVSRQQQGSEWRQQSGGSSNRKNEFWGDARRGNVALSRGKHGLVVIGNLLELAGSEFWERFLTKALQFTVACTPDFIRVSANDESRHVRGVLADEHGLTVQDYRFHAQWNPTPPKDSKFPQGARKDDEHWPQLGQGRARHSNAMSGAGSSSASSNWARAPRTVWNRTEPAGSSSSAPRAVSNPPKVAVCRSCGRQGHVAAQCRSGHRRQ